MTNNRWRASMKSFRSHIDPEKDEQLKWIKIEIENRVRRIVKLTKNINQGNKDVISKKKSEVIQLIDEFHKQYQSLYALYDNLKGNVRKIVSGRIEEGSSSSSSSSSSSDSESFYSPDERDAKKGDSKIELWKSTDCINQKVETSYSEDAYLKDKLTSTSEVVKEALTMESVSSFHKTQESGKIIKDLDIEAQPEESTKQKLMDECSSLKEKLVEREKELLSFTKAHQVHESEASARIMELEGQVTSLKVELENFCIQKRELQEKIECKAIKAKQLREENLGLQAQILEVEMTSKEKEDELAALLKKYEENEKLSVSKFEDLMVQANTLQLEVDSLRAQKGQTEERLSCETNKGLAQLKGLTDGINVLQEEMESLSSQETKSKLQLEKKSQELSKCLIRLEILKEKLASMAVDEQGILEEKEGLKVQVKDLELEVNSLCSQKSDLEEQIISINQEDRTSELERRLTEREDEISTLQKKIEVGDNHMSNQIMSLTAQVNKLHQELESLQSEKSESQLQIEREKQESLQLLTQMEKQNSELTKKIADQQRTLKEMEDVINKFNQEHQQVRGRFLGTAERKMEEMAEEFRKKFEDNLRLLGRRIRVAEQLHVENKDWNRKTKEKYEQENKDLTERITINEVAVRKITEISVTANDTLIALDTMALKFEECSANFMNRISKFSCELKFAKNWVMRKNKAIKHVKEDLDCLLIQLDDKEAEVLTFREKVWKLENKVRELEKMGQEKEEGMLSLGEEKREAIRQLCVWIDHHRSRSDYLKKMLPAMKLRN